MIKKSIKHLSENKMTYYEHFVFASTHGLGCLRGGLCLICHAILPAVFPTTGSSLVKQLNKSFNSHKPDYL